VVYFHEAHAVQEWVERMNIGDSDSLNTNRPREIMGRDAAHIPIAACHDEPTARLAKSLGFPDVYFARKRDVDGLTKTVMQAVDHAKQVATERVSK
jgi:hypothetical protein